MEELGLQTEDFQGKININAINGDEKVLTKSEFERNLLSKGYDFLTDKEVKEIVENDKKDAEKLEKAGENVKDEDMKSVELSKKLNRVTVSDGMNKAVLFVGDKDVVEKARKTKDLSKKQENKISKVMKEYSEGDLKDSQGNKVTEKDRALAIAYQEADVSKAREDELKKGGASDALRVFNGEDNRFVKTGQELKDRIPVLKNELIQKMNKVLEDAKGYVELVGVTPSEEVDKRFSYICSELNEKESIGALKAYDRNMEIYGKGEEDANVYNMNTETASTYAKSEEQADYARRYNRCIGDYLICKKDYEELETPERNIDTGKNYQLRLSELEAFKF